MFYRNSLIAMLMSVLAFQAVVRDKIVVLSAKVYLHSNDVMLLGMCHSPPPPPTSLSLPIGFDYKHAKAVI